MLVFISLILAVGVCSADSVEVRGTILDSGNVSSIEWDGSNWGALYFALNDAGSNTESLCYENVDPENPAIGATPDNNVIDENELIYRTHTYNKKFKLSAKTDATAVSTYSIIPLFGKKYIAVNDDASKMTTLITEQGGGSEKTLKEGESWDLGKGYSLTVKQLDLDGGKVWLALYKDGAELDSKILSTDGADDERTFVAKDDFAGKEDAVYFVTYVDEAFKGASDCFVILKYTWLVDKDDITSIEVNDEFGALKCTETSVDGITLSNDQEITLEMSDTVYFTDDWYFRVSKAGKGTDGGYLFYPAMKIIVEDKAEPEVVTEEVEVEVPESVSESNSAETLGVAKAAPNSEVTNRQTVGESNKESAENPIETPAEKTPGFGALFTIPVILAVLSFTKRK
ncbi:S-layer protein domain-containing protein [Methanococcoides sp. NM1]|uniref:S-layer protein domain-containing protein n=1 Tax=Methanococcoides sp. NM1 TaxID=1201013 RepID=UPI0010847FC3|nr:S-layer protein domain-containing protein [Methanococcoides sp. NM1]